MTKGPEESAAASSRSGGRATGQEAGGQVVLEAAGTRVAIDRATGRLASVERDGRRVSLANGPRIVEGKATLTSLTHRADGDGYVVEAAYEGKLQAGPLAPGRQRLARAVLPLREPGPPRAPRRHVRLPGGPGHGPALARPRSVPRLEEPDRRATHFDVWQKPYNDTRTGADWTYPEFKGHHADLYWAVLDTQELPITVVTDTEDLFLRVLTPRYGVDPTFTAVAFPEGDISFLHAIAPIGTKFDGPETLGPESQMNEPSATTPRSTWAPTTARLFFRFGESAAAPH